MAEGILDTTDDRFDADVAQADGTVLVDFWAEWCRPCLAMNPILTEFAAENAGRMKVVKVNVDENPRIAERFRIASIPTMMVFKKGEVVKQLRGATPKARLDAELAEWLGQPAR